MKRRLPYYGVLLVGLVGYYQVSHRVGFAAIRTVDILQLLASGACIGAFFAGLFHPTRGANPKA